MTGLNKYDPIMADIKSAVREGYFDRMAEEGPSELARTPVAELLKRVEMMSPTRRRNYLRRLEILGLRQGLSAENKSEERTRRNGGLQGREVNSRWGQDCSHSSHRAGVTRP